MRTVTTQISDSMAKYLDKTAKTEKRSKSWIIKEALTEYMTKQKYIDQMTMEGLHAAREGKLIPHEEIEAELKQWGSK